MFRSSETLATTYKREATTIFPRVWASPAGKEAQSCGVYWSQGGIFLTHCTFISSACEMWKQAISLLPMSALHVTPWEGHCSRKCCRLHYPSEQPAPLCKFRPGPATVQVHFLNSLMAPLPLSLYSFLSYILGNVLFGPKVRKCSKEEAHSCTQSCPCMPHRAQSHLAHYETQRLAFITTNSLFK